VFLPTGSSAMKHTPNNREVSFILIDAGSLREPLCYKSHFVSHHLIVHIPLSDEHPFEPNWDNIGGVWATSPHTCLFESESNSVSIASFHLTQYECFLHSAIDFGSGSSAITTAVIEAKLVSIIVVFRFYNSPVST
jgi:hypothetical protein